MLKSIIASLALLFAIPATHGSAQSFNAGVSNILTADVDCCNQGIILAQQVTLTQSGLLQSISYYTFATGSAQMILGVYDSTGPNGGPGNLLASTNAFAVGTNSFNTTNVLVPVMLASGSYWLAYEVTSNNTTFPVDRTIGTTDVGVAPFGALPSVFPDISIGPLLSEWTFYMTLDLAATPPPTPTPTPPPTPTPTPTPPATTLAWDPPSTIVSYVIEYGTVQGGPYPNTINVGLVYTFNMASLGLASGTYFARTFSLDANNNPSCETSEVSFVIP